VRNRSTEDAEEVAAEEATSAHATGLLAIALGNTSHCEEAVRSGFVGHLIAQLHAVVADMPSQVELKSPSARQQSRQLGVQDPGVAPVRLPLQVFPPPPLPDRCACLLLLAETPSPSRSHAAWEACNPAASCSIWGKWSHEGPPPSSPH